MIHTVRLRAAFCCVLFAAAACADSNPAAAPEPIPAPAEAREALSCAVDVRASTLACRPAQPEAAAGVRSTILGGQGVYVRLKSSGTAYDAGTGILRSDVTVENLTTQMLGTADGQLPDPAGVRVFFASGPTVTDGTGLVTVESADGTGTFTQGGQSYIQYPGILAPGDTTAPKEWRFAVPSSVVSFSFTLYVAAPVLVEEGWVSLTPVAPAMMTGQSLRLSAVVRSVTGAPVAGARVTWSVSDDGVSATVDSTGLLTVHDVLYDQSWGTVDVIATSGGRTGKARVYVSEPGMPRFPGIAAVDVSPTLVDNDGADSVTVRVTVSDPLGVESVEVDLDPAFQQQTNQSCTSAAPATGTRTAGAFVCRFGFPAGAPGGVWELRSVVVRGGGGLRYLDPFEMKAAGVRSSIYVRGPVSDYIPPTLGSFTFSPDSVRTVFDTVTIDVAAADADSGIAEVLTRFYDGGSGQTLSCSTKTPRSGTIRDGSFRCRMRIPGVVRSEHLEVQSVLLKDRNGNGTEVTGSELAERGYPTLLKVQPDTAAPTVSAFSLAPATVAANGVDSVSVTATAADPWTGVRQMDVQLRGATDALQRRCFSTAAPAPSRTFRCALRFPAGSQGTWRLDYLRIFDAAGNMTSLNAAQAQAAGYPTEITVTP